MNVAGGNDSLPVGSFVSPTKAVATHTGFLVPCSDGNLLTNRQKTLSEEIGQHRIRIHIPSDLLGRGF